jgi:hypothetical protein
MLKKLKIFLYHQFLTYKYVVGKAKHYHYGQRKSKLMILRELLAWQWKEHDFNTMYYAMGLNLAGSRQKDYIGRKDFLMLKDKVEQKLKSRAGSQIYNYDVVTKDKFIANSLFTANNIPCIENTAIFSNATLLFRDGKHTGIEGFKLFNEVFFIKNTVLEAGDGVLVCKLVGDNIEVNGTLQSFDSLTDLLGQNVWVVQHRVSSSKEIKNINSTALNTTRIVTVLNGNNPEYLCGFQSFATGGATTDSWSKGSVYVGIDIEKECLKSDGYCNLDDTEKSLVQSHPDSGIVFAGYKLPGLRDAVKLCLNTHRLLYFNFAVGWDVAITDHGPLIIEANEKPGMNVVQCTDEGIRQKINHLARKLLD